jgi:hypothetical protein
MTDFAPEFERQFFLQPVFDAFKGGEFHKAVGRPHWNLDKMIENLGSQLIRSEVLTREVNGRIGATPGTLLFRLEEACFVGIEYEVPTVYAANLSQAKSRLTELARRYSKPEQAKSPRFYILRVEHGVADTVSVKIPDVQPLDDAELAMHYGEDFPKWEKCFIEGMSGRACGASLLRGEPGTGKTSFLRQLIAKLTDSHRFYYLPIAHASWMSEPAMVNFWLDQLHCNGKLKTVVVLEDAESLIVERSSDNQHALANLLNVSDGLLGDFLQLHLILTINARVERLDPALLRPGRLLASREFRRLDRAEAERLAQAKNIALPTQADYTLAEIYHSNHTARAGKTAVEPSIGFRQ